MATGTVYIIKVVKGTPMKLSFFTQTNEYIAGDAYDILDQSKAEAYYTQKYVTVYNHSPGQHKHGSVYLIQQPANMSDTPMAEMYGG